MAAIFATLPFHRMSPVSGGIDRNQMRREDVHTLQQPYPQATPISERFADALGVGLPAVRELQREVLADLDESRYGVGWWAPHPGTSRRILISDHLLICIRSIESNLLEARLHLTELRDFDDQQDRIIAHAVKHDGQGKPFVKMPPRAKPTDDLPQHMGALHITGFFRAVGSALDCLGAAIIGVLALPTSILRSDLDRAIGALAKVTTPTTNGETLQAAFGAELTRLVARAGPPGWLPWAMDYRNMLVHRGRRLELSQLVPRGGVVFSADARPIMLARAVRQLAQDPGLSDVEVLVSAAAPVLTEEATTTLEGVLASSVALSEGAAAALVDLWKKRRLEPTLLTQPKEQWREGRSSASRGFAGYKPGTLPFSADLLVSDDTFAQRLKFAALDDRVRKKWDTFD